MSHGTVLMVVLGVCGVLALGMLALFTWAGVWMVRDVLRQGPRPRPAPSRPRVVDVEPVSPRMAPRPWYLNHAARWDDDAWMHVNPATGLPIIPGTGGIHGVGGIDVSGTPFGMSNDED